VAISCYERDADFHGDKNAITHTWPQIAKAYPALLIGLAVMLGLSITQSLPRGMMPYTIAVLVSMALLGWVHYVARRASPELSHVLADVAVALPMALIWIWT
jgi:hypothetical protein